MCFRSQSQLKCWLTWKKVTYRVLTGLLTMWGLFIVTIQIMAICGATFRVMMGNVNAQAVSEDFWVVNIFCLLVCGYQLAAAMYALMSIKVSFLIDFHDK